MRIWKATIAALVLVFGLSASSGRGQSYSWARNISNDPAPQYSRGEGLVKGLEGSYYVTGGFRDSIHIGSFTLHATPAQGYLAWLGKFDSLGSPVWVRQFSTGNVHGNFYIDRLAADSIGGIFMSVLVDSVTSFPVGNVIVTGSGTGSTICLARVDSGGTVAWARAMDSAVVFGDFTSGLRFNWGLGIATDSAGNCNSVLQFFGTWHLDGASHMSRSNIANLIVRLNRDGQLVWDRVLPSVDTIRPYLIAAKPGGELVLAGYIQGTSGTPISYAIDTIQLTSRAFISRFLLTLDRYGMAKWGKALGDPLHTSSDIRICAIATDTAGQVYASGGFTGNPIFESTTIHDLGSTSTYSGFAVKYSSQGRLIWARMIGDSSASMGGIQIDHDQNVYCSFSNYAGVQHFGDFAISSNSAHNFAVAKLDRYGLPQWVVASGDSFGSCYVGDLYANGRGSVYLDGDYTQAMQLGTTQLSGNSQGTYYLARIADPIIFDSYSGQRSYCPGDTIRVSYYTTGAFGSNNQFTAQLSSGLGEFDTLGIVSIGKLRTTNDTGVIVGVIPRALPAGTHYRLRVDATSPRRHGLENGPMFTILQSPTAKITPRKPTSFCQGGSDDLVASGGKYFRWSSSTDATFADTAQTIVVSKAGTYFVAVTDTNGCMARDSIVVHVNSLPIAATKPNRDTAICEGDSLKLTASGGVRYSWSTGETKQSIEVKTAGIYSVTAISDSGCTATSSPITVSRLPLPATPSITDQGDTLTSSADFGNQWYRNGNLLAGDTTKTLIATANGTYTVTTKNANGCEATSTGVKITNGTGSVARSEPTRLDLKIIPNPFGSAARVEYTLAKRTNVDIEVVNLLGATVAILVNRPEEAGPHSAPILLGGSPAGAYLLRATFDDATLSRRIVLKH